jgi:hypothetical protein
MRVLAAVTLSSSLAACATAQQPLGYSGAYADPQFGRNLLDVSVHGDRADRAEELALLSSAEATLKNGFTHFLIIDWQPQPRNVAVRDSERTAVRDEPSATVMYFNGNPGIDGPIYDAEVVFNSLAQKYGVAK